MHYSIGLFAHNEEKNIQQSIQALLSQKFKTNWKLTGLYVVVSGSSDQTISRVKELSQKHSKIKLLVQKKRLGKVAAINLFLSKTKSRYLVLANADNLAQPQALEHLLQPLKHKDIAMTCGRIIPQNQGDSLFDHAAHLQWHLHHKINLQFPDRPKAGELIAAKRVFTRLNHAVTTDEANLEAIIRAQGFQVRYCPESVVHNYGPTNLSDFLNQRRRIFTQHLHVRTKQGYQVVTMSNTRLLGVFLANLDWNLGSITRSLAIMGLEIFARGLGYLDYLTQKTTYTVWKPVQSTKKTLNLNK